jgi:hypothetical protein
LSFILIEIPSMFFDLHFSFCCSSSNLQ